MKVKHIPPSTGDVFQVFENLHDLFLMKILKSIQLLNEGASEQCWLTL